ncbi:hypothetical protein Dimus_026897 [Dionaea muscipula]
MRLHLNKKIEVWVDSLKKGSSPASHAAARLVVPNPVLIARMSNIVAARYISILLAISIHHRMGHIDSSPAWAMLGDACTNLMLAQIAT